jgi:hypothetical protein
LLLPFARVASVHGDCCSRSLVLRAFMVLWGLVLRSAQCNVPMNVTRRGIASGVEPSKRSPCRRLALPPSRRATPCCGLALLRSRPVTFSDCHGRALPRSRTATFAHCHGRALPRSGPASTVACILRFRWFSQIDSRWSHLTCTYVTCTYALVEQQLTFDELADLARGRVDWP